MAKAKILLIEDDPLVIRMYQKILIFEGFEVQGASDGREGVEKASNYKPDLIFCDVMMPKINGIQVLERLKADPLTKDIPVIMLTNLSGTQDAETAIEKGAIAYFIKSEFKPKEVAAKAKELIQSQLQTTQVPTQESVKEPAGQQVQQQVPAQPTQAKSQSNQQTPPVTTSAKPQQQQVPTQPAPSTQSQTPSQIQKPTSSQGQVNDDTGK